MQSTDFMLSLWERLRAGGEGNDGGWDGCMALLTQWTWVWVNSRSWWWTGRPGVLWFMGLQRVRDDWVTELKWTELKETKELYTENYDTNKRNQRQHKQMERYSMFLHRKNQYCENGYTTKCNLHIQCNPYQITKGIFHKTRRKIFTIHMETQKTLNSQSSLEKEEWKWRNQPAWLQALLQSHSH